MVAETASLVPNLILQHCLRGPAPGVSVRGGNGLDTALLITAEVLRVWYQDSFISFSQSGRLIVSQIGGFYPQRTATGLPSRHFELQGRS